MDLQSADKMVRARLSTHFGDTLPSRQPYGLPFRPWFEAVSLFFSPYQLNPLDYNPLRH